MKRGHVLFRILTTINNVAVAHFRHPGRNSRSYYRSLREFRKLQDISDRELHQMVRYAIARKYLINVDKKRGLRVGKKGETFLLRRIDLIKRPARWDKKWRIVMFDIPNAQKGARDSFAVSLKRAGFQRLQKSVFICPYPCEEGLKALATYLDISENIEIVVSEHFTREEEYKKRFALA